MIILRVDQFLYSWSKTFISAVWLHKTDGHTSQVKTNNANLAHMLPVLRTLQVSTSATYGSTPINWCLHFALYSISNCLCRKTDDVVFLIIPSEFFALESHHFNFDIFKYLLQLKWEIVPALKASTGNLSVMTWMFSMTNKFFQFNENVLQYFGEV